MVNRKRLVIYFNNDDFIKNLERRDVSVHYISKKDNYALIYFDKHKEKEVKDYLKTVHSITSILDSDFPFGEYSF